MAIIVENAAAMKSAENGGTRMILDATACSTSSVPDQGNEPNPRPIQGRRPDTISRRHIATTLNSQLS